MDLFIATVFDNATTNQSVAKNVNHDNAVSLVMKYALQVTEHHEAIHQLL